MVRISEKDSTAEVKWTQISDHAVLAVETGEINKFQRHTRPYYNRTLEA